MQTNTLSAVASSRRAGLLGVALFAALLASDAGALPQPKVIITYSLEVPDGGAYRQRISDTPLGAGDADFVFYTVDSGDPNVTVFVDSPLTVTMEFTADAPGGNIVDGPVELTHAHFEREFEINSAGISLVHTTLSTVLSRKGTGTLTGSTITWENQVAPYQEAVVGLATCEGFGCDFVDPEHPFPRDLSGTFDVPLPTFTVFAIGSFGDAFASDNGTPADRTDDIDRPAVDATVKDLWEGVEVVPEPGGGALVLAGVLGLAGLCRLRARRGARA